MKFAIRLSVVYEMETILSVDAMSAEEANNAALARAKQAVGVKSAYIVEREVHRRERGLAKELIRAAWERLQLAIIATDDAGKDFDEAIQSYEDMVNAMRNKRGLPAKDFINVRLAGPSRDSGLSPDALALYDIKVAKFLAAMG